MFASMKDITPTTTTPTLTLGGERTLSRMGFGTMRLTGQPGNYGPYRDWGDAVALLREAAELGVEFFDSARSYGPLWTDKLLGEAFDGYGERVFLATKGGVDKVAPGQIVVDGRPETLAREIDEALVNLRRERIDLFQLHRVDPEVPVAESVGAIGRAVEAGKVRFVGLSNVSPEQLREAESTHAIASVQNRFHLEDHRHETLLDYAAERGMVFIPHGPLGASGYEAGAKLPVREALTYLLERAGNTLLIPGTTSPVHLRENVQTFRDATA